MHRLLVVQLGQNASDKFRVVADSGNPAVSEDDPVSIEEAGGSGWGELNSPAGFKSRFASIPCRGVVSELGYWRVGKTGEVLEYDFADLGVSERKVIVGGELHLEYDGRRYVARPETASCSCSIPTTELEEHSDPSWSGFWQSTSARRCIPSMP